jgi:TonB family protein
MRATAIIVFAIGLIACGEPGTPTRVPLGTATARTEEVGVLAPPAGAEAAEATVETPASCEGEQFLPVSRVDKPPAVETSAPPKYPALNNRAKVRGAVVLRVFVRAAGGVCAVELVKGVASDIDESVLLAVRDWKFKPAMAAGKPTGCFFSMTVNINLSGA